MSKYTLIIFNRDIDSAISCLGGKLVQTKDFDHFSKLIEALSDNDVKFYVGAEEIPYCIDDFSTQEMSLKEFNKLKCILGIDDEEDRFGIFPDVLNDAIDYDLMNEFENEENDDDYC